MLRLATFLDLYRNDHTLGLYCIECDRWVNVDLNDMLERGFGDKVLAKTRFSCKVCGTHAEKQLRPPVPRVGGSRSYISPARL